MTLFLQIAAFALGTYLSIRMIVALHGIADLWYMIAKAWPRIVADILVWVVAIGVITWLMDGAYRTALIWGLSAYLVFYLSLLPLMRLYVTRRRTDRTID